MIETDYVCQRNWLQPSTRLGFGLYTLRGSGITTLCLRQVQPYNKFIDRKPEDNVPKPEQR